MRYYASGKHVAPEYTWKYAARRWRRNVVTTMTAGALALGTTLSPVALSGVALADPFNTQATTVFADTDNGADEDATNGATNNSSTSEGGSSASNTATSNEGSTSNTADDANTNANSNTNANEAEESATTTELTDPTVATPNETFGTPTTSVVIEGSVNGEIMAQIALAEPDGTPEGGDKNKYNYGSGEAWCAYFVMYCARAARLDTSVIPNYANCQMLVDYYKDLKRWQPYTNEYRPHVGDLIFFSETQGGTASHVGIVTASTDTTVTTREGNTNMGKVATHVFSTTSEDGLIGGDYYILGYASPDYPAEVTHEHVNNVKSILNVSETAHLVTYDVCECGYQKTADLVEHNFKSTNAAVKLSESDEWECIDCGAQQTHYTTGIRASAKAVTVYGVDSSESKQLPAGTSLTVTGVSLGADGNYWGVTAEGYRVQMSDAGVKQATQFAPLDMSENERATAAASAGTTAAKSVVDGRHFVAGIDWLELADGDTVAKGSAEGKTVDATYKTITKLKAGNLYILTIDEVESAAADGVEDKYLGSPIIKLMDVAEDGSIDVNDMRIYGASGQKISFSDGRQGYVIAPERDTTLVLACQGGKKATANDVIYQGINVYRLD